MDQGGTIDPSCFVDEDGSRVLIYKNDGNSMGKECWLYMRRLEADGVTLVGEEVGSPPVSGVGQSFMNSGRSLWEL